MFTIPIYGEIDGKTVKVILGNRYRITTNEKEFEGTVTELKDNGFLVKTVKGGFIVDFKLINKIEEI